MHGITPQMAQAELARRQAQQQSMPPQGAESQPVTSMGGITPEMAKAELQRRQGQSAQQNAPRETMNPFMAGVTGFNTGVERFAHGVLQPLLEGPLGQRVKQGSERLAQQREQEFKNALASSPTAASIGEVAGGIVGTSPTWAIPGVGKNALVRALAQGALQGGVMGAGQYSEGNKLSDRAVNALAGAGMGAASYPMMRGLSSVNPYIKAGTGAALGTAAGYGAGIEDPEKMALAAAGGAAAPFVPGMAKNALTNAYQGIKSKITGEATQAARTPLQNLVSRDMLAQVNPAEAIKRKEAAERLGLTYLTPAEASGSPVAGKAQGKIANTKEANQMMFEKGQQRLASERSAIKTLFNDVYPNDAKLAESEKSLYTKAHESNLKSEDVASLAQDPVIADALENVGKKPAFAKDLKDTPQNSIKYLDYAKKYLDDQIGKAKRAGENNEVRLLTDSKNKLLETLDNVSPEYKEAREIAARRLTRQEFEKALNDKDIRGTNFYNKLLKNDKKFGEMRAKVKNIPGAQEKLDDMRLVFQDLINPTTARTEAGLAKTNMTTFRNAKDAVMNSVKEMLGGKYDKAAVNLITSPKWDKEFAEIAKLENKEKRGVQLTNLLAKIATSMTAQTTARGDN